MNLMTRRRIFRTACKSAVVAASLCAFYALPAVAQPFDCMHHQCGLLAHESTPDIVVGVVESVATPEQMMSVFHWARAHGYWQKVPANAQDYLDFMQLISISVKGTGTRSVTVSMTREEYNSGPLKPGALVRYAPHDLFGNSAAYRNSITHQDPVKESYWWVLGCVAQLCAPQDDRCLARYQQGRFDWHTGSQLHLETGQAMPHGVVIDPVTLLPKPRE
ncbi:MAG: hypothetical protein ACYC3N_11345 [Halothiobacillus sp.]